MDDQRFDNLSRIIARSTTRRATVKGIAAAIGGGIFASVFGVRAQRAGAQGTGEPGDECTSGDFCATGLCSGVDGGTGQCYCEDPAEPLRGCGCDPEEAGACGGGSLVCCPTEGEGGICTSGSVGCNPTGECQEVGQECAD